MHCRTNTEFKDLTEHISKLVIITIGQRESFALVITRGGRRMDTGQGGLEMHNKEGMENCKECKDKGSRVELKL